MKKKIKVILALAASIAVIAIGQRQQSGSQDDVQSDKAEMKAVDADNVPLFI